LLLVGERVGANIALLQLFKKKKKLGYPGLAQVTGGDQVVPLRNAST
jgi:hypothetical protein